MAAKAIYLSKAVLDTYLKNGTPYIALLTTAGGAPTGSAAGTELTGNNYSRTLLSYGAATGTSTGTATNALAVGYVPSAQQVEVSWWALYDAATSGNRLYYGALAAPFVPLANGLPIMFVAGAYTVTES